MGQYDAALQDFNLAIEMDPSLADAHNGAGVVHDKLGNLEEARKCYTKAIEADKEFTDAYVNRGDVLVRIISFNNEIVFGDSIGHLAFYNGAIYHEC
jgi:tetratricopeptide (TPR) repeat protein